MQIFFVVQEEYHYVWVYEKSRKKDSCKVLSTIATKLQTFWLTSNLSLLRSVAHLIQSEESQKSKYKQGEIVAGKKKYKLQSTICCQVFIHLQKMVCLLLSAHFSIVSFTNCPQKVNQFNGKYRNIWTRKNSIFGHFLRREFYKIFWHFFFV